MESRRAAGRGPQGTGSRSGALRGRLERIGPEQCAPRHSTRGCGMQPNLQNFGRCVVAELVRVPRQPSMNRILANSATTGVELAGVPGKPRAPSEFWPIQRQPAILATPVEMGRDRTLETPQLEDPSQSKTTELKMSERAFNPGTTTIATEKVGIRKFFPCTGRPQIFLTRINQELSTRRPARATYGCTAVLEKTLMMTTPAMMRAIPIAQGQSGIWR